MLEFLTTFDLMLQNLTNWLSYAAIVLALVLAVVGQLIYFIIEKKENRHEHL